MRIEDFEKELQAINKDLSIRPNNAPKNVVDRFPDVNKIASVLYCGEEICSMPNYEIFDEKSASYGVDLRGDGSFKAHRIRPEVLSIVKEKLELLKDKDYADAFFGRGDYSPASLNAKSVPTTELVDEVPIEVKEVGQETALPAPETKELNA